MRALIITPKVIARCVDIVSYARQNIYELDAIKGIMILGAEAAPGNDARFRITIPKGFRVVFTYERQPEPVGLCSHLSVSIEGSPGAMPNPVAVSEIGKLFGITEEQATEGYIHAWLEPLDYDPGQAINILHKVEITPEWKEFRRSQEPDKDGQ